MKMNKLGTLVLAIIALLLAACASNNNGKISNKHQINESKDAYPQQKFTYRELDGYVFVGDSITEGLLYHQVLSKKQVLAGAGKTAHIAIDQGDVEELVKRDPNHVYIQLGSTDILWPTDDPISFSMTYYAQLIEDTLMKLPDVTINLLSVTPVTKAAEDTETRYKNIAKYNEALKSLAVEKDVNYIDLSQFVEEHSELYDADGIHFQSGFYPLFIHFLMEHHSRSNTL